MIANSSGLFPHFLGVLSKVPVGAHNQGQSQGQGQGQGSAQGGGDVPDSGISHPFSTRVPKLLRRPHHPDTAHGQGAGQGQGSCQYGGPVFGGSSSPRSM